MKTEKEIVKALKRIPYSTVADAINKRHLNSALRKVPLIVYGRAPANCPDGGMSPAMCQEIGPRKFHYRGNKKTSGFRLVPYRAPSDCRIVLDLKKMAKLLVQSNGRTSVTAVLAHELTHAIQFENCYTRPHGRIFEECCLFACHSGLRVCGEKICYVPVFGVRYPVVPNMLRKTRARRRQA